MVNKKKTSKIEWSDSIFQKATILLSIFCILFIIGLWDLSNKNEALEIKLNQSQAMLNLSVDTIKNANNAFEVSLDWNNKFMAQSLKCVEKLNTTKSLLYELENMSERMYHQLVQYKDKFGSIQENGFTRLE